jgi:hypothetical protein
MILDAMLATALNPSGRRRTEDNFELFYFGSRVVTTLADSRDSVSTSSLSKSSERGFKMLSSQKIGTDFLDVRWT